MGHRLSKIYTRTGDKGDTGLGDGNRIAKDDPRVEAYGTVDELNSAIGIILAHHGLSGKLSQSLIQIQHELFDMGGELSIPGYKAITDEHVTALEERLDNLNQHLKPLKEFILPGGHPAAAATHLARTICRRAERRLVTFLYSGNKPESLDQNQQNQSCLKYLNRLSDLLFVIARYINYETDVSEPLWHHDRKKK